ncbi:uncharacterized protein LOC103314318 [Tribolium castaneum]|uniref:Ima1 N-terminal domain-containing protein n=1 Tax=Tribolium castaneum TaxID=7070 RepID=D6WZM8_TRICA|nr:PREDICTED: uncharacterized protein LOC103314318 [Tribolium castaneum]EFA09679.2 hypothetical protein TcasGA2_TC011807 [Tribolium castaneum]|eukprot:XP_008198257.1 PREDICTED: uncharacterized protein LOC103314318 [Tribolium castaneum]
MLDLLPFLSTILPIIASSLVICVFVVNLYLRIRRKFPISVNCWFCNSWTKVPYDDRDGFDCPTCSQYNGFTSDGGYNKIIPEQHDEFMNKSTRVKSRKSGASNGLCALCNNNQQLKVFQLAHFVPMNEENYDVEIEHFQEQLEKAYKLCKKCDKVLKKTISKQNAWIFGNRVRDLCHNGISKIASQIRKETKLTLVRKLDGCLSILCVLAVIFTTLLGIRVFTRSLSSYVPTAYLPVYKSVVALANTSKIIEVKLFPFTKNLKIEPHFVISGLGFLFQMIRMCLSQYNVNTKVNQLLCWVILLLTSWLRFSKTYTPYILFIEAFSCIYLLSTAFTKPEPKKPNPKPTGMRKLVKNLEYTTSDISDCSDFEDISDKSNSSLNTATVLNSSFKSAPDLNRSLNNLSLGFKPPPRPKPVLSPPKLQTVNSWVAGGFWREGEGLLLPPAQRTNLSRCSSESSGFGSQLEAPFVPKYYEFDRFSHVSEPNFRGFHPRFDAYQRKSSENWSEKINSQAMMSFRDLSLRSNY